MSEPMVSHDCVAFNLLSEDVSKQVKVVQSGQGADEIFAGYSWYPPLAGVPRDQAVDAYAREFFDRPHERPGPAAAARSGCSTPTSAGSSWRPASAGPAPPSGGRGVGARRRAKNIVESSDQTQAEKDSALHQRDGDLVPPRDVILFSLNIYLESIELDKPLQIFNRGAHRDAVRPVEIILHVKKANVV